MDQLQSAKSALERALAEVEVATAALSTGDNQTSQECSECLASSESSDELSDVQCQHRPSKASVHVDQEMAPAYGELNPRPMISTGHMGASQTSERFILFNRTPLVGSSCWPVRQWGRIPNLHSPTSQRC
ncbi:hypothetical protein FCOIX_5814 [Fusarium coicis]|nr:hypothetical protein FCOIX_5814 [Fusarium coicis]